MNHLIQNVPVLILNPYSRCNCRCVMCDIWKNANTREISTEEFERQVASILELRVKWVVFSGGEPLMHSDLFHFCRILREHNIRVTVLSTGLLLERHSAWIINHVSDVIVSLDGPPETHDRIRRVPGAFRALERGVQSLRMMWEDYPIAARCTVQKANASQLRATIATARALGLNSLSFLAVDLTSTAFNRADTWGPGRQAEIAPSLDDLRELQAEIDLITLEEDGAGFVVESAAKLRKIVHHFRAQLGAEEPVAPVCNAPWVSMVVDADETVRPCFFHQPIGRLGAHSSLIEIVNSPEAVTFRQNLDIDANPICQRCVCSLNWRGE